MGNDKSCFGQWYGACRAASLLVLSPPAVCDMQATGRELGLSLLSAFGSVFQGEVQSGRISLCHGSKVACPVK